MKKQMVCPRGLPQVDPIPYPPRRPLAATACLLALLAGLVPLAHLCAQTLSTNTGLLPVTLSSAYQYQPVSVTPCVAGPTLPVDLSQVPNANSVEHQLGMGPSASDALATNGFVVVSSGQATNVASVYSNLCEMNIPLFITSDSMLHHYHIQFDGILRTVETNQFLPQLETMSQAMLDHATQEYAAFADADLKEAARRNVAFFTVALNLLGEPVASAPEVADIVSGELANVQAQSGFLPSPLFNYLEDYSQFIPRGHYTLSADLERYFQAMMWYGQMVCLLKGGQVPGEALVTPAEARIQTLAAFLMSLDLDQDASCASVWNRIYSVTAFFVGLADDLTPYDYKLALMQVFGAQVNVSALTDDATFLALRKALAVMPNPQIYGGTGDIVLPPDATAADLDAILDMTKGLRLMGQRYIPDSYMFQQLVFPSVGPFTGTGTPFTLDPAPPIRGFPRGLDVMVVLGSPRALALLDSAGDTDYVDYDQRINELRRFFLSLDQGDWTRNLYWSWLYALRPLLEPCGPGYPPFMQTLAWQDKQLNSALCSWAELRHDTILYAKQSTTPVSGVVIDHTTAGYVEPVPEVFERLRALAQLTRTGLDNLSVLDPGSEARLTLFESTLARLRDIAVAELQNQPLSASDSDYICNFFMLLSELSDPAADPLTENTTLVADAHTDANIGMVLEEGVGNVKVLVAACAVPQIGTFLAAGPVLTGYEFKWPMSDRLTDPAWSSMLANSTAPAAPGWTSSFMDPVTFLPGADASTLQLGRSELAADGFHLCWQGDPARRYRALFSDDLSNWFLLQTPSPAQAGAAQMVDPAATNSSHRFYTLKPVPN